MLDLASVSLLLDLQPVHNLPGLRQFLQRYQTRFLLPIELPTIYLAHGPGGSGSVNAWDFTEAVRYWQDHANYGFMLNGDSRDYFYAWTREAAEVRNRPALLVIYEPR